MAEALDTEAATVMLATVANYPKSATEYLLKLGFSTQQRMITAR